MSVLPNTAPNEARPPRLANGKSIFDYARSSEEQFFNSGAASKVGEDDPEQIMAACIGLALGAMWAHYLEETGDFTFTGFETTPGEIITTAYVFASATDEEWTPSVLWPYSKKVMHDFLVDVAGDALERLAQRAGVAQ